MSATLHVTPLGPILRAASLAVKDKSYQRSPIGRHVARYLRALRWQDASPNTLDSYETTLARLSVDHDDFEEGLAGFCTPVGTEYLREFLDRHWSDSAPATRAQRLAAVKSCFEWAVGEGVCSFNPASKIKAPRRRTEQERVAYPQDVIYRLVKAQDTLRDQVALQLLGRMGLRKNELRLMQIGDIDLIRNLITVNGKGGKVSVLPLAIPTLRDELYLHIQGEQRHRDEYLIYPRTARRRPMDAASVHRWFKRCLEAAGIPDTMKLHELRHTAADDMYRKTGDIVRAQQLLRHSSVLTTQGYLHPTRRDLADALRVVDEDWARR